MLRTLSSLSLALSLAVCATLAMGCVGELEPQDPGAFGIPGGPDATPPGVASPAHAYYDTNVAPLMIITRPKGSCASCHQGVSPADGPDFLGNTPSANYSNLVTNTRLVGATPAVSILVTKGDHNGNAYCTGVGVPYGACTADEVTILNTWIMMEANAR
jgi:mono/diheme cytochrome c family protein